MSRENYLSVVIPTFNCGSILLKCLESVKWANEIIVVDMGSTDNTLNIVKKYTTKIFLQKLPKDENFDWNRLYGMRRAKNEWLLKLDSDEELSFELQRELILFTTKKQQENIGGMWLRNRIFFFGKRIKHGPVKADSMELRLFRRGRWKYNPLRYHQQVYVDGKTIISRGYYNHFNYRSVREFLEKTNKYTELDSEVLKTCRKFKLAELFLNFPAIFIKLYIFQKGLLDRRLGIIVCWLYAFYYFVEKLKIIEKQNRL